MVYDGSNKTRLNSVVTSSNQLLMKFRVEVIAFSFTSKLVHCMISFVQSAQNNNKKMSQNIDSDARQEMRKAKKLLTELENYIGFEELCKEWKVQKKIKKFKDRFVELENQLNDIQEEISKKNIKIFFFGSVSSGKTRLINAILGGEFFMSTMNHTTKCFVHIMKSPDAKYKIVHKNQEFIYESKNKIIEEVEKISTFNKETSSMSQESVKVFIPIGDDNKILKGNVELIDSPGTGDIEELIECVQNHLSDADICIYLLCNDVSEEDERFFNIRINRTTKPDIFILVNKWDQSDQDQDSRLCETYKNLVGKCFGLVGKFGGPKTKDIDKRIIFISAIEVFGYRIKNKEPSNRNQKIRYADFERFEDQIEEYIQNPQQLKTRRYKREIKTLLKELNIIIVELSKQINNIDFESCVKRYEGYKTQALIFKEITRRDCEKLQLQCKENIECKVTKMLNTINIDNKEINEQITQHYDLINKSISDLFQELEREYSKLASDIESISVSDVTDQSNYENTLKQKISVEVEPR